MDTLHKFNIFKIIILCVTYISIEEKNLSKQFIMRNQNKHLFRH